MHFSPVRPSRSLPFLLALAALLCGAATASAGETDLTNPLRGKALYMDCDASHQSSARQYNAWYAARKHPGLTGLRKLAQVPGTKWFAGIKGNPKRHVERFFANVDDPQWGGSSCKTRLSYNRRDAYAGRYPVVAIRRLVNGNCTGMRRQSFAGYKAWIDAFVKEAHMRFTPGTDRYQFWMGGRFPRGTWSTIPFREMTIILEPDAIGLAGARRSCLKRSEVAGRLKLLRYAAQTLSAQPGFNVYIDAGSSSWLRKGRTISYLRQAGVQYTRGFALGSTHFNKTGRELAYGDSVARALGGKHYVVNTAENAHGALPRSKWGKYGSKATACNPRNAGLGIPPTTKTGSTYADAFLWISRPGLSSNGKKGHPQCGRKNGPTGNVFWIKKALWEARQANFRSAPWPYPAL